VEVKSIMGKSVAVLDANRIYGGRVYRDSHTGFNNIFPSTGGIFNAGSGMGGVTDKSGGSFYIPRVFSSSAELQTIYAQSWAARKFIDIPVDDQFVMGRSFEGDDEDLIKRIKDFEEEHEINIKLAEAQKAGRLYGTAILWFVTSEDDPIFPINLARLKPGDLKNLIVVDRYGISSVRLQTNPLIPGYMKPLTYNIVLPNGTSATVHHSRVCRFDGKNPLTINGFQNYGDQWFGISELTDILPTIENEDMLAKGISHLSNEASIPVIKFQDFDDAICSGDDDETDFKKRLQVQSLGKSIFRTTFLDAKDSFERVAVTFTGLPDLMDKMAGRLAAAADIPETRFLGRSPAGLNATGDGDMQNYAIAVNARQEKKLRPVYTKVDAITGALLGVDEFPEYTFPLLVDIDDKTQAETLAAISLSLSNLVSTFIIDENESRDVLRQNKLFKSLEDESPVDTLARLASLTNGT